MCVSFAFLHMWYPESSQFHTNNMALTSSMHIIIEVIVMIINSYISIKFVRVAQERQTSMFSYLKTNDFFGYLNLNAAVRRTMEIVKLKSLSGILYTITIDNYGRSVRCQNQTASTNISRSLSRKIIFCDRNRVFCVWVRGQNGLAFWHMSNQIECSKSLFT